MKPYDAAPRPPAGSDPLEARREARLRVFRGEDPLAVVQFLRDAREPAAAALVEKYRAKREACIRSRARADLIVCAILLLAVLGMQAWIRPYGMPPKIALWFLLSIVGLKFAIHALLVLLKGGNLPGDYSGLMPPDPELDPRLPRAERLIKYGVSPLVGYGLIFLAVAIVIGLGARVMDF